MADVSSINTGSHSDLFKKIIDRQAVPYLWSYLPVAFLPTVPSLFINPSISIPFLFKCTFLDGLPAGPEDAFVSLPITSDTQVNNE